jgi:uncharacterized delta-60 repeat protein
MEVKTQGITTAMRPSAAFFIASLAALPRIHAAPGDLDPSFSWTGPGMFSVNANADMYSVASLALQPDGKIVAAGGTRLVRILPDGTLDPDFNSGGIINLTPQASGQKWQDVEVQPDGKIIACSTGANPSLRRWNSDGTPDTSFNGNGVVALPSNSFDLTLDKSGRILVGLNSGIVRYMATGEIDPTFGNGGIALLAYPVISVASIAGGSLIVAVSPYSGTLKKLDADGIEDLSFPETPVRTMGGSYSTPMNMAIIGSRLIYCRVAGQSCLWTMDFDGIVGTDIGGEGVCGGSSLLGFAMQRDGKPVIVGSIDGNSGLPDITIRRIRPEGGLDQSFANMGTKTIDFGNVRSFATRAAVQRDGKIVVAVISDASLVVLRLLGDDPDITVEHPLGTNLAAVPAPTIDFGPVVAGQSQTRTVYLSNRSPADLEGLQVVRGTSGTPSEFAVVSEIPATVATGESVPLTVVLTPSSPGQKSATLAIQSNDPDESPFSLSLTGRQATATDLWRQRYFGSMDETGAAEDQSDPDADGIPNLVEFALGSHPKESTPAPGTMVRNGSTLEFTYWRSKAALGEIAFVREFSQSLAEGWSQIGGMVETIVEETPELQKVLVTTPAGTAGRRFIRLRVTRR